MYGSQEDVNEVAKNFKVVVRIRPPLPREMNGEVPFKNVVHVDRSEKQLTIVDSNDDEEADMSGNAHRFTFDYVYDRHASQQKVYETTAKGVVDSSLKGYNATIFAYGQTGTGKTYTMEGFNSSEQRGIIPRAIEQIFQHIKGSVSKRTRFLVRASYLQIYNEQISDLLKPERTNLLIREDKKKGVFVEGLSEWVVRSPEEIYGLMKRGGAVRATGSHRMNEMSSRSHAVFIIICEQSTTTYVDDKTGRELLPEEVHSMMKNRTMSERNVRQSFKVGKLNLVDLAGSERVRLTGATGLRLEESKKINQSLSALGNVIAALTDPKGRKHIPYRDSKLTRILEDSLGGNCKTTMMAMASPALEAFTESISTLKFANRAKNIKNKPRVNEDVDQRSLLRKYERELNKLRTELKTRSQSVVDKRRLLEMDQQRRQAEQDKMAAIRALEARSVEMMKEKAEKRKLERRISTLQSQMLVGGVKDVKSTPAFRTALEEQQQKIRHKYNAKMAELERERESIEEEKAQVDRYKQLLLKQRDIMIALTQRLNERDEQIMALQDELDAYDRHQKGLEEKLDEKTAALIHLQRVTMEYQARSPVKSRKVDEALGTWAREGEDAPTPIDDSVGVVSAAGSEMPNISPKHLLSTRQFEPHANSKTDSTVMMDGSSALPTRQRRLSAVEKIKELQRIVAVQQSELGRSQKVLEEVKAEKVSMEYLLRERLDKLVQSEIESRLASHKHSDESSASKDATIQKLRLELGKKAQEISRAKRMSLSQSKELMDMKRRLKESNRSEAQKVDDLDTKGRADDATSHAALIAARERCATHEKERRAILTIMEQKIKALVQNATLAARSLRVPASRDARVVDVLSMPSGRQLDQELRALQRLVNASVVALKNSMGDSASSSTTTMRATGVSVPRRDFSRSTPLPRTNRHGSAALRRASKTNDRSLRAQRLPSRPFAAAESTKKSAMRRSTGSFDMRSTTKKSVRFSRDSGVCSGQKENRASP